MLRDRQVSTRNGRSTIYNGKSTIDPKLKCTTDCYQKGAYADLHKNL